MVRGVSQLFGVKLAENFRQPYFSISLGDFWRRWHITLGAWMRDYVFYPFALRPSMQKLGKWSGDKLGRHWGRTLPASIANILVFFLVGLWHGADAHFIWWGLYNGIVIAAADLASPLFERMIKLFRVNTETAFWHVWRILRTFIVVNIGWYFDRIEDFGTSVLCLKSTLLNFDPAGLGPSLAALGLKPGERMQIMLAFVAIVVVFAQSLREERRGHATQSCVAEGFLARPVLVRGLRQKGRAHARSPAWGHGVVRAARAGGRCRHARPGPVRLALSGCGGRLRVRPLRGDGVRGQLLCREGL